MTNSFDLRDEELATILAALRFYQEQGMGAASKRSAAIHDIATNGDTLVALDDEGLNNLCEWLNHGGKTTP